MTVLGIETSTRRVGVAVLAEGRILAEAHADVPSGLMSLIARALREATVPLRAVSALAVSVGPGSFTGLRVGVTTVKGLAIATGIPAVGIPTLQVLAANLPGEARAVCAVVDARRGQVYGAVFQDGRGPLDEAVWEVEELVARVPRPVVWVGDGVPLVRARAQARLGPAASFAPTELWHPLAVVVARLGAAAVAEGRTEDPLTMVPRYLRSRACHVTTTR